jgi:hypothetical protein
MSDDLRYRQAASARREFRLGATALSGFIMAAAMLLPFGLMMITTSIATQAVLVVSTIILATLALQANTHHAAIMHIEAFEAKHPTHQVRDRLVLDASLLAISSVIVTLAALLLLDSGTLSWKPLTGVMTWTEAFVLAACGVGIVLLASRPLIYFILAVAPIALPALAYADKIDLLTIALWQCLISIVLVITTIEFQLRSLIAHRHHTAKDNDVDH